MREIRYFGADQYYECRVFCNQLLCKGARLERRFNLETLLWEVYYEDNNPCLENK